MLSRGRARDASGWRQVHSCSELTRPCGFCHGGLYLGPALGVPAGCRSPLSWLLPPLNVPSGCRLEPGGRARRLRFEATGETVRLCAGQECAPDVHDLGIRGPMAPGLGEQGCNLARQAAPGPEQTEPCRCSRGPALKGPALGTGGGPECTLAWPHRRRPSVLTCLPALPFHQGPHTVAALLGHGSLVPWPPCQPPASTLVGGSGWSCADQPPRFPRVAPLLHRTPTLPARGSHTNPETPKQLLVAELGLGPPSGGHQGAQPAGESRLAHTAGDVQESPHTDP